MASFTGLASTDASTSSLPCPCVDVKAIRKERVSLVADLEQVFANGLEVHPMLSVIPLGFSWSFCKAQVAHQVLAGPAHPDTLPIHDKRPVPDRTCKCALSSTPTMQITSVLTWRPSHLIELRRACRKAGRCGAQDRDGRNC